MATNYLHEGSFLTLSAPYDLNPGDGALVGIIFGVSQGTYASGAPAVLGVEGVWFIKKVSTDAFLAGAAVYWDNTAKLCTSTASGNTKIGVAVVTAINPSPTVDVRLNESF